MEIKVYGNGCPECVRLEAKLDDYEIPEGVTLSKVTSMEDILTKARELNIRSMPFAVEEEGTVMTSFEDIVERIKSKILS